MTPIRIFARVRAASCVVLALWISFLIVAGCGKTEAPAPTKTKDERRMQEKEIMQREMRNK